MVIEPNIIRANQEALLTSANQMQEIRHNISQVQNGVENAERELRRVCDGEFMQMFQSVQNAEANAFSTFTKASKGLEHSVIAYKDIMAKTDEAATNAVKGISLDESER